MPRHDEPDAGGRRRTRLRRAFMPMSGVGFLVRLSAFLYFANEPAGDQRASRAYDPADQGNACRADGKLKVSAAHSGRRIEQPGKTERVVVLRRQVELPLLRPVRAAAPYRDRRIDSSATAILQQHADLTSRPDCHDWFRDGTDTWPDDKRAPAPGMAVRPGFPPR